MATKTFRSALIVEDQQLFGDILGERLRRDLHIPNVRMAPTVDSARKLIRDTIPDLVVLDYWLPDGKGLDFYTSDHDLMPGTDWLLCTGARSAWLIRRALLSGFRAVVSKDVPSQDFIDAVRHLQEGKEYLCPACANMLADYARKEHEQLTERELRALELLADGFAPKEIAAQMGLTQNALNRQIRQLCEKLGAHGGYVDAVNKARAQGLVA